MKIIDASKLINWLGKNNVGGVYVKLFPLLDYISDAENHQPHIHGRYVNNMHAQFTNPELLILAVDASEFLLLNRKSFDFQYLEFRRHERDKRRIERREREP